MRYFLLFVASLLLLSCSEKRKSTFPEYSGITSSIYASGIVKSKHQYQLYSQVQGLVQEVYVDAGDSVKMGDPILLINSEQQDLNKLNSQLSANFYSSEANSETFKNFENKIEVSLRKKEFDSLQYQRQKILTEKDLGLATELERTKLNYENSVLNYQSTRNEYEDYKRQLNYNRKMAQNNFKLSSLGANNFILRSDIEGKVYSLSSKKGEMVNPQQPVAIIGSDKDFVLEMLIDEKDILNVTLNQLVKVHLDSYENKVFDARVTKIYPIMDIQNRTFKLEAHLDKNPETLYPNMNFEANIILETKEQALLIPREYLIKDSLVLLHTGDTAHVQLGLMDYQMVEVLSGLAEKQEIVLPEE